MVINPGEPSKEELLSLIDQRLMLLSMMVRRKIHRAYYEGEEIIGINLSDRDLPSIKLRISGDLKFPMDTPMKAYMMLDRIIVKTKQKLVDVKI